MRAMRADLHVHTCLSPCAEAEMVPTVIVDQAKRMGLDVIGICDHNSAENVGAVLEAGRRKDLPVIPGMEITSREEVHVLALFRDEEGLSALQHLVYGSLPGENDPDVFGEQTIVDERDDFVGHATKLLIGATGFWKRRCRRSTEPGAWPSPRTSIVRDSVSSASWVLFPRSSPSTRWKCHPTRLLRPGLTTRSSRSPMRTSSGTSAGAARCSCSRNPRSMRSGKRSGTRKAEGSSS